MASVDLYACVGFSLFGCMCFAVRMSLTCSVEVFGLWLSAHALGQYAAACMLAVMYDQVATVGGDGFGVVCFFCVWLTEDGRPQTKHIAAGE